jgi:hypothetical protein
LRLKEAGYLAKELRNEIENSMEFFDIICSSKDCAPEMKKKLLKEKRASIVFYPKDREQVRKILANHNCVIRGGATSYLGQIIPEKEEAIIDMSKFNSVHIFNDTAIVDSGTPFIHIMKMADANGMELRVCPLSYRSATPAGFLSNGGRIGLGSPENGSFADSIEELEVVTPNSEILILKGNDIMDFEGSEGILGVITSLKIKLQPKKVRFKHMYGFDERIDLDRFFDESKNISMRYAYFFNDVVAGKLNEKWQLKDVPKYTLITEDNNEKDDYGNENREMLSIRGVSFVYPKWIVELENSRINKLDFMIKENRNFIHVADAISNIPNTIQALKYGEKYNLPVFGMLGKDEILLRYYANCRDFFDIQKFLAIMGKVYEHMLPATRGRFFEKYFIGTKEWKRLASAKIKYNITKSLSPRPQINKMIFLRKMFSPAVIAAGGKLW